MTKEGDTRHMFGMQSGDQLITIDGHSNNE